MNKERERIAQLEEKLAKESMATSSSSNVADSNSTDLNVINLDTFAKPGAKVTTDTDGTRTITNKDGTRLIIQPDETKILVTKETMLMIDSNGIAYDLGRNAQANWAIYKKASNAHTVFHLEDLTSPYVIINRSINDLTTEMINRAAIFCKSNSKHKNMYNLKVLYTPISNTKLGDAVGSFIVISNHKKKIIIV